jgi:hypothetical protein
MREVEMIQELMWSKKAKDNQSLHTTTSKSTHTEGACEEVSPT